MSAAQSLATLADEIISCRRCPRLVDWREHVAAHKRAAFGDWTYWGRGVPGFGDPRARIVLVGLAPAAHGANRTGRMFTGDRSGDWLYRSLYRAGLASQPNATSRDDGLELTSAYIAAAVRCAPPDNKPSPDEFDACLGYLVRELELLEDARVIVALGALGYRAAWRALGELGVALVRPRPKFGHGVEVSLDGLSILCSYHPSQQNTFTGRLTAEMLDDVFDRACRIVAVGH